MMLATMKVKTKMRSHPSHMMLATMKVKTKMRSHPSHMMLATMKVKTKMRSHPSHMATMQLVTMIKKATLTTNRMTIMIRIRVHHTATSPIMLEMATKKVRTLRSLTTIHLNTAAMKAKMIIIIANHITAHLAAMKMKKAANPSMMETNHLVRLKANMARQILIAMLTTIMALVVLKMPVTFTHRAVVPWLKKMTSMHHLVANTAWKPSTHPTFTCQVVANRCHTATTTTKPPFFQLKQYQSAIYFFNNYT
ncbi:hypothetical protein BDF19DRAFT_430145 [Syncephalis fuscata]|nr:hypothetical protein BDF19DRAFT_430145 [Syncephalis fuscata]